MITTLESGEIWSLGSPNPDNASPGGIYLFFDVIMVAAKRKMGSRYLRRKKGAV
jgi:hypothetical protein